jgi:SAM-dependent methyltransferase
VWSDPPRYDPLDTFVDGILRISVLPRPQLRAEPEMVYYQPTPARIVLDMVDRLALSPRDVVYDLGSGLGRVVCLVALVSEARGIGVEFEPAYAAHAQRCARDLGLARAAFVNADAREVTYGDGTVFFLYTPFKGAILQRVVELLRYEAGKRRIRVCTYGPGTLDMLQQEWLVSVDDHEPSVDQVAIFENRSAAKEPASYVGPGSSA